MAELITPAEGVAELDLRVAGHVAVTPEPTPAELAVVRDMMST
jgi:hypothetical protein